MKLVPRGTNVLLKLTAAKEMTAGGLHIPDSAKEKPQQAEVISVGPAVTAIEVGQTVLFQKFAGVDVVLADVEHLLVLEENILGVIES